MCLLQNRKPLTVEEMYEDMSQVKMFYFKYNVPCRLHECTTQVAEAQIMGLHVQTVVRLHKSFNSGKDLYGKNSSTLELKNMNEY